MARAKPHGEPRSKYDSVSQKLKKRKKITDAFEVMLNGLTMEELISLKIEMIARGINGKYYGYKLFTAMSWIAKEAVLVYAYMNSKTSWEGAALLGMTTKEYAGKLAKYNIKDIVNDRRDKQ